MLMDGSFDLGDVNAGNEANLTARSGVVKIEMPRPEAKVVDVYTQRGELRDGMTGMQIGVWVHGARGLCVGCVGYTISFRWS